MYPYDPIEAVDFPGFYEIPGFNRYAIAKDGSIISKYSRKLLSGYEFTDFRRPNARGYQIFSLINDEGKSKRWPRHRLMCLIFKYPGICFKNLEVNHINGIKGDDWLDNLEWVTSQENTIHAFNNDLVSRTKTKHPISVRDVDTGEIKKYPNINACARDLDVSVESILWRLNSGEKRIYPERKQYRHSHSDDPWYISEDIEKDLMLNGSRKRILMRNVITNNILEFDKLRDLADHLNLSPAAITKWSGLSGQPVLPGFIQLKWSHDDSPWRYIDDPYLELNKLTGKCVVKVLNTKTNESKCYLSAVDCARDNNVSPTTLNWRLKSNGKITYSDGCTYAYYS